MGASSTTDDGAGANAGAAFHGRRILTRRVFVSSTSRDLSGPQHPYRAIVMDSLLRLDLFPKAMEQFNARGAGDGTEVSLDELPKCDLYIGIVAWRYGYIPAGQALSITHQEYRKAKELGRPCYIFLADPTTEAQDGPDTYFPAALRDPEHRDHLAAFRAELERENIREYFTSPDDLGRKVAAAMARHRPPRPPRTLPPPTPGFVGRTREVEQLCHDLRRGQSVGLSAAVAGMAGVGKSTLAQEVVRTLAAEPGLFPSGLTWVRCDGRTGLEGLAWIEDQLLAAWHIKIPSEEIAAAAAAPEAPEVAVALRERHLQTALAPVDASQMPSPALVLLDNVEATLPVGRLVDVLAGLNILTLLTSRHIIVSPRLRVQRLDVLEPEPAVTLLAERYQQGGGTWDEARDAAAAGDVVGALGSLPLAIELAAARAARSQLSIGALAEEMRRPDVLGRLNDPLRNQASVRYAFEHSLGVLSPAQRTRFAALGLLDGPDWPRPIIEVFLAVVSLDLRNAPHMPDPADAGGAAADDLDLLASLSLATLLPPETPGVRAPRVRLHPLLHDLAREEWARQPRVTRGAGLAALLAVVGTFAHEYSGDFARLAREEELLAGTLRQAAREHVDPSMVAATMQDLLSYFSWSRRWRLGMDLLSLQLQTQHEMGDRAGEGAVLNNLGSLARAQGRQEEAARYYEQALAIVREVGDRAGEGATLYNLGELARAQGQPEEAARYYEQALAIVREVGDRHKEGPALNNLGSLARGQGRLEEAARNYEQALAIVREEGDRVAEVATLNNLDSLARAHLRLEEATRTYEQAMLIALRQHAGVGPALNNPGLLARAQARLEEATRTYEQVLATAREEDERAGERAALNNLGGLAHGQGRQEEAPRYVEQALTNFKEIDEVDLARSVRKHLEELRASSPPAQPSDATPRPQDSPLAPEPSPPATAASSKRRRWWPFGR